MYLFFSGEMDPIFILDYRIIFAIVIIVAIILITMYCIWWVFFQLQLAQRIGISYNNQLCHAETKFIFKIFFCFSSAGKEHHQEKQKSGQLCLCVWLKQELYQRLLMCTGQWEAGILRMRMIQNSCKTWVTCKESQNPHLHWQYTTVDIASMHGEMVWKQTRIKCN